MNWIALTSMEQLHAIKYDHTGKISAIFKHSTRCSISTMALSRLERSTAPIKNGSCFYNETHGSIIMEDIIEAAH